MSRKPDWTDSSTGLDEIAMDPEPRLREVILTRDGPVFICGTSRGHFQFIHDGRLYTRQNDPPIAYRRLAVRARRFAADVVAGKVLGGE